jgi:hypothetical protein
MPFAFCSGKGVVFPGEETQRLFTLPSIDPDDLRQIKLSLFYNHSGNGTDLTHNCADGELTGGTHWL